MSGSGGGWGGGLHRMDHGLLATLAILGFAFFSVFLVNF